MSDDPHMSDALLDWFLREPEEPWRETDWGRGRSLTYDELRAYAEGRGSMPTANIVVTLADKYEAEGMEPGAAIRRATEEMHDEQARGKAVSWRTRRHQASKLHVAASRSVTVCGRPVPPEATWGEDARGVACQACEARRGG